jgi:hypothetical protein
VYLYLILVEKAIDQDKSLSHSDQLALLCEEEIKRLEEMNTSIHYYALPEMISILPHSAPRLDFGCYDVVVLFCFSFV